jgi:hypothetical protein
VEVVSSLREITSVGKQSGQENIWSKKDEVRIYNIT